MRIPDDCCALLINADYKTVMHKIPDGYIDLIYIDPPYGVTDSVWDKAPNMSELWGWYNRILKPMGVVVIHSMQPFTTDVIQSNRHMFHYCLYWDKCHAKNFLNAKKQPMGQIEELCVFYSKSGAYNQQFQLRDKPRLCSGGIGKVNPSDCYGKGFIAGSPEPYDEFTQHYKHITNLLRFSSASHVGKTHPNQKPIELAEHIIKMYSKEGQVVLDNFMGSGTSGVAAVKLGRLYIGIESDKKYYRSAFGRISEEAAK